MIAAFIAMLWLIPFDTISLTVSLPFDLHLDRIVLPFIIATWGLVYSRSRRDKVALRLTPIHAAIGAIVLVAFVSVVLNGAALDQSLLLKDTIKQLLLLGSYAMFFVIVATTIRPAEVRPMLTYTLVLAVLCGLGTLAEFRFHYNVFYSVSAIIFPHAVFDVAPAYSSGLVDEIGRLVVLGPGEVGLEVASMLAMAVPLAIVGVLHATTRRTRIGYGLAACVLLAAGVSTDEKTSLVAPVLSILVIIVLRPRLSVRLIPIFVAMFVAVHVLAPGAIGSVTEQFSGGRLNDVGTTQHREAGYDAIRPLVWSEPALGMGYGSYNGPLNRILDNQMLDNLIDTGVIGEVAFLVVPLAVMAVALPLSRSRLNPRARDALAAGSAGLVFLIVSCLFDDMSFPHVPYIFLTAAGFTAVLWQEAHPASSPTPAQRRRAAGVVAG